MANFQKSKPTPPKPNTILVTRPPEMTSKSRENLKLAILYKTLKRAAQFAGELLFNSVLRLLVTSSCSSLQRPRANWSSDKKQFAAPTAMWKLKSESCIGACLVLLCCKVQLVSPNPENKFLFHRVTFACYFKLWPAVQKRKFKNLTKDGGGWSGHWMSQVHISASIFPRFHSP